MAEASGTLVCFVLLIVVSAFVWFAAVRPTSHPHNPSK